MRRDKTANQRIVKSIAILGHIGKRVFGIDAEKQRQVARLKIEIDENSARGRSSRQISGHKRSPAATLARKDSNHPALLFWCFDLAGAVFGHPIQNGFQFILTDR